MLNVNIMILTLQPTPLFTIVRRPEENDGEQQIAGNVYTRHRNAPKSAPVPIQNNYGYMSQTRQGRNEGSIDSLAKTSAGDSQLTTIDDCRLRQLLEELYKDKKYFDHYVENTGMKLRKDCLWKQRTHKNHEYRRLGLIASLICNTVVCEAAYAPSPPPPSASLSGIRFSKLPRWVNDPKGNKI